MIDRKYFKTQLAYDRQKHWVPEIAMVMAEFIAYALTIGVKSPLITESVTTVSEDRKVNRKHDQHRTCVAGDGRVSDWSGEQIDAMISHLNTTFAKWAYVTGSGFKQIAFNHDNGNGPHFHIAVNAKFKKKEFEG